MVYFQANVVYSSKQHAISPFPSRSVQEAFPKTEGNVELIGECQLLSGYF